MSTTMIATYESGKLYLPRPLNLPERTRVRVSIESLPEEQGEPSGNILQQLLALATDLGVDDLSEQHDHYLYGTDEHETAAIS